MADGNLSDSSIPPDEHSKEGSPQLEEQASDAKGNRKGPEHWPSCATCRFRRVRCERDPKDPAVCLKCKEKGLQCKLLPPRERRRPATRSGRRLKLAHHLFGPKDGSSVPRDMQVDDTLLSIENDRIASLLKSERDSKNRPLMDFMNEDDILSPYARAKRSDTKGGPRSGNPPLNMTLFRAISETLAGHGVPWQNNPSSGLSVSLVANYLISDLISAYLEPMFEEMNEHQRLPAQDTATKFSKLLRGLHRLDDYIRDKTPEDYVLVQAYLLRSACSSENEIVTGEVPSKLTQWQRVVQGEDLSQVGIRRMEQVGFMLRRTMPLIDHYGVLRLCTGKNTFAALAIDHVLRLYAVGTNPDTAFAEQQFYSAVTEAERDLVIDAYTSELISALTTPAAAPFMSRLACSSRDTVVRARRNLPPTLLARLDAKNRAEFTLSSVSYEPVLDEILNAFEELPVNISKNDEAAIARFNVRKSYLLHLTEAYELIVTTALANMALFRDIHLCAMEGSMPSFKRSDFFLLFGHKHTTLEHMFQTMEGMDLVQIAKDNDAYFKLRSWCLEELAYVHANIAYDVSVKLSAAVRFPYPMPLDVGGIIHFFESAPLLIRGLQIMRQVDILRFDHVRHRRDDIAVDFLQRKFELVYHNHLGFLHLILIAYYWLGVARDQLSVYVDKVSDGVSSSYVSKNGTTLNVPPPVVMHQLDPRASPAGDLSTGFETLNPLGLPERRFVANKLNELRYAYHYFALQATESLVQMLYEYYSSCDNLLLFKYNVPLIQIITSVVRWIPIIIDEPTVEQGGPNASRTFDLKINQLTALLLVMRTFDCISPNITRLQRRWLEQKMARIESERTAHLANVHQPPDNRNRVLEPPGQFTWPMSNPPATVTSVITSLFSDELPSAGLTIPWSSVPGEPGVPTVPQYPPDPLPESVWDAFMMPGAQNGFNTQQ